MCGVIAITGILFLALSQHLANRLLGIGFATYLAVLWRPALVAITTGGAVLAIYPLLPTVPVLACAGGGAVAAIAGLVGLRIFAWGDVVGMWRSARGTSPDTE